ncbi:MAG: hypothetical protein IBX64_13225 [Actinobacteria bacterium]|nr:hypothetical protein [Actinomycetota bacterium]
MSLDKQFDRIDKIINKMVAGTERKVAKEYAKSLKTIYGELGAIYAKYEVEGVLTYAEMTKYNRLATLFDSINGELKKVTSETAKLTKTLSADVYEASYFRTAYAFETELQLKLGYALINPKVIEAAVQNPISGLTLNERLAQRRAQIIIQTKVEITQGLIQGESYPKMVKRIKGVYENDLSKSRRIIQTEAHRVQVDGRFQSMLHAEARGVAMVKVWQAALDDRTRDIHASLDGQKRALDEDFKSPSGAEGPAPGQLGAASEDINCRCAIRPDVEGYEPQTRAARGEEGKTITIPYQTYDEWFKNRVRK